MLIMKTIRKLIKVNFLYLVMANAYVNKKNLLNKLNNTRLGGLEKTVDIVVDETVKFRDYLIDGTSYLQNYLSVYLQGRKDGNQSGRKKGGLGRNQNQGPCSGSGSGYGRGDGKGKGRERK